MEVNGLFTHHHVIKNMLFLLRKHIYSYKCFGKNICLQLSSFVFHRRKNHIVFQQHEGEYMMTEISSLGELSLLSNGSWLNKKSVAIQLLPE